MQNRSAVNTKDKVEIIQKYLRSGRTREELGAILGYKSWRSLDILMRRNGMRWDSQTNTYYTRKDAEEIPPEGYRSKAAMIISGFRDKNADPMEIAHKAGFDDHRKLSSYMAARGYIWSGEMNNYIEKPMEEEISGREPEAEKEGLADAGDVRAPALHPELEKYLPLLEILAAHRERLLDLLLPESAPGTVPRYTVPGVTRTKSFYMSDLLSQLINEFSRQKNISQKEIIEAAIIEFLRKYSFKKQVDQLLGRQQP